MMRNVMIAAAVLLLAACQTLSPAPKVTEARQVYADCLGKAVQKVAKTDMVIEDAADTAIAACANERAALGQEVGIANHNDTETAQTMTTYDAKVRSDALDYLTELRKH